MMWFAVLNIILDNKQQLFQLFFHNLACLFNKEDLYPRSTTKITRNAIKIIKEPNH
jgi:hypothetical protein